MTAMGARTRMTARIVTALVGGYAASSGLAAAMARLAPISRAEATLWAMILSFLVYAAFILWAFYEQRLLRVAGVIWGLAAMSAGLVWLAGSPA